MTFHNRLMHGASFRGLTAAGARAEGDAAAAAMIATFNRTFEEFKAANDARLKELEKGVNDPVQAEKVNKINTSLDEVRAEITRIMEKFAANELSGSGATADIQAQARDFSRTVGQDVSAEDLGKYANGLDAYMRVGADNRRFSEFRNLMEVGSDPAGGYTVTPDMSGRIIKKIFETSPARQLFDVVSIGTDAIEGMIDRDDLDSGWVGEKQARPETGTPELGKWRIDVHEQYAMPKVTQKLLDDSGFNIEAWLSAKVADKFTRTENSATFSGDGVNKPRGILTYSTAATDDATRAWEVFQHVASGSTSAIQNTDFLIDLVFKLKAAYRAGASWTMNRKTLGYVRTLKDGQGSYLWQPDFTQRQGGSLLGYGIVEAEDMPDIASNALSIGFGDFKSAYQIVDRMGIRVLRDPYTEKGFVKLYTTKRMGGGALDFDAVKFMKFAA
ncbi:phage major capsid protein [Ensifer aridi]|uniref:phage major capsid protein n=1 Tax=Ensifer aridi TaxID=1708715 RepID=UPI001FCDAE02|nr:phage major capsid protein [Ensifer aridi]